MNIYENNKQLLTTMGGDSANLATDYEVRKAILDLLGGDSSNCNSIYEVDKQILNIYLEGGGGTGGEIPLIPITITDNGVYVPEEGGYNEVIVDIPFGELVVSANGEYLPENGVKAYDKVTVNVEGEVKKAKVTTLKVNNNNCIVDGYWPAENIDTSLLTDMSHMFSGCTSLQQLDVSNWDTSKVTTMYQTFYTCTSLQQLDVSNWDTSKVTSMFNMFNACKALQQLDVSNWDTSNVTNMYAMFRHCPFQTLDVSGWITSNVKDMGSVFRNCTSLQQLDVSNWDTSNVTSINNIFESCGANNGTFNAVGRRTIDEVISGNIGILNGLNTNIPSNAMSVYSDRATLRALINGVADRTGQSSLSMTLGSTLKSKLTDEDIAIATAKNWTIA